MLEPRDLQTILLSQFIHNRDAFRRLSPEVSPDAFTDKDFRAVYDSMLKLEGRFTVPELAADVGNLPLVRDLTRCYRKYDLPKEIAFKSVVRIAGKVDKIGRLSQVQALLTEAQKQLGDVKSATDVKRLLEFDPDEFTGRLMSDLVNVQGNHDRVGHRAFDYYMNQYAVRLNRLFKGGELDDRLSTGWRTFDKATGGGLPNGLTVIAGPPGCGKTQMCLQLGVNVADRLRQAEETGVVAINSIEMLGVDLVSRTVLSEAEIDSSLLRLGNYNDDRRAKKKILKALRRQQGLPIYVDDSDVLTSNLIAMRVSGLKARFKDVVLVITDFLELVRDKGDNAEQRAAAVILNAKALSKRIPCPVVIISHLSRQVDMVGTRVPSIRHLRMSGMIEALSDTVGLIYNPQAYRDNGIQVTPHPQMPPVEDTAYIILGKNRNGPTGFFKMGWLPKYTKWYDLAAGVKHG